MIEAGTISAHDLDLMLVTDSVEEAMTHLEQRAVVKFGLTRRRRPRPSILLGERPGRSRRPHHPHRRARKGGDRPTLYLRLPRSGGPVPLGSALRLASGRLHACAVPTLMYP